MKRMRKLGIESGVANAVDTVVVDKAMTAAEAYRRLADFVTDGLSTHGIASSATARDLEYAKTLWPLDTK